MLHRRGALLLLGALSAAAQTTLSGAGATFPAPLYDKWFRAFEQRYPDWRVHYDAVGSEAGIHAFRQGATDFAASDMPLDDRELSALGRPVLQFPTAIGAVVPIYHLEGVAADLRFTPESLAGIFLGRIRRWNDPALQSANRGVRLPNHEIAVVHRSDGSGTTYIFTDYLTKVSSEWKTIGAGATVPWPVGAGAEHNEGVAEAVQRTPFSIGYVEFIYALQNHLSYGSVRNPAGHFVHADLDTIPAAAADCASTMPPHFQLSITAAPGRNSYPISGFTYLLISAHTGNQEKDRLLRALLDWVLSSGQRQSAALGYGSLPAEIITRVQQALASGGQ